MRRRIEHLSVRKLCTQKYHYFEKEDFPFFPLHTSFERMSHAGSISAYIDIRDVDTRDTWCRAAKLSLFPFTLFTRRDLVFYLIAYGEFWKSSIRSQNVPWTF